MLMALIAVLEYYTNLFDGFLTNMNKQQQEQDSGLMSYLPIVGIGIIGIFLIKKLNKYYNNENRFKTKYNNYKKINNNCI